MPRNRPLYDAAMWVGLARQSVKQGNCVVARERIANAWKFLGFALGTEHAAGRQLRRSASYTPLLRAITRVQKQMADHCCRNGR